MASHLSPSHPISSNRTCCTSTQIPIPSPKNNHGRLARLAFGISKRRPRGAADERRIAGAELRNCACACARACALCLGARWNRIGMGGEVGEERRGKLPIRSGRLFSVFFVVLGVAGLHSTLTFKTRQLKLGLPTYATLNTSLYCKSTYKTIPGRSRVLIIQ